MRRSIFVVLIIVGASLAPARNSLLADEPEHELTNVDAAEARIELALAARTTVDFSEAPLREAIERLKHLSGLEIVLDEKALNDAGIDLESPITMVHSNARLAHLLNRMLRPYELVYVIQDEVLLVTTDEVAKKEMSTKVYRVGDLIGKNDFGTLVDLITTSVIPKTWDEEGGLGSITPYPRAKAIVIYQSLYGHREIATLLRHLRHAVQDFDQSTASRPATGKPEDGKAVETAVSGN